MFVSIVLAAAVSTPAPAGRITSYTRDQMHIYDENGALVGAMASSSLPPTPTPIVGESHQHLGIMMGGKTVYLRNAEVITAGLRPICTAVANAARKGDTVIPATPGGVRAGLGEPGVTCDPKGLK